MEARNASTLGPSRLMRFDEKSLRERVQGNETLFDELVGIFLGDLPKRVEEIRSAMSEMNFSRIGSTAHTLKGTAALMGAQRLASAARELESSCQAHDRERVPELFASVFEESERLRHLLMLYHREIKP